MNTTSPPAAPDAPRPDPKRIRPASTILLLRPGPEGIEVLLLKRNASAAFLGGAYVFPGGAVEPGDREPAATARFTGITPAEANARMEVDDGALAYWYAAVRECFEEAGLLLAADAQGRPVEPARMQGIVARREALQKGELTFTQLLESEGLFIAADAIAYMAHWITPVRRPRRFDTRFFMAQAPVGQLQVHDDQEAVDSVWLSPRDAVERCKRGEVEMGFPTRTLLAELRRYRDPELAYRDARMRAEILTNRPVFAQGKTGERLFRRDDAPYHEIWWTDPGETSETSYDIEPGVPKRLDRLVTRITAGNPGMMTGPGTNSYLVGEHELALIDPGPADDAHIARLISAGDGRIRWILATHTHRDHSPAAAAIARATGAALIGRPAPPHPEGFGAQDETFVPTHVPEDGELLQLGPLALTVVHTPGHASNHLCYLLRETGMLFSGDHVMQGSTVVINPPDGDMRVYLASLERLLDLELAIIAPGHGYLVGDPHREVRRLIAHRLAREAKVVAGLASVGPATLEELVVEVYQEVDARLHRAAMRSLLAHLLKLEHEGRARRDGERWASAAT